MTTGARKRIAIALGDANGIGPEIAVKAALALRNEPVDVLLVGDAYVLQAQLDRMGEGADAVTIVDVPALPRDAFVPGQVRAEAGAATVAYVRAAVGLAQRGEVDAVVGCPHSETSIHQAGITFSGYPGLIAELTGTAPDQVFLLLVCPDLKIGHVTLHEPLTTALARLTPELVVDAAVAVAEAMGALGVPNPRMGVFGINPHAGEDGLFGTEDETITKPAVARLRERGLRVDGPIGADLLLSQRKHDVYLAMYHDQGHIPVKLLSPLQSSALSVGGGIFFSSVGHGCAFDIAGRGVADATATIRTVRSLAGLPG